MAAATCVSSAFRGITLSTSLKNTTCSISHAHHSVFTCFASKKNNNKLSFMDQILDYIEGGPKLRKWYGAPDILPKDASNLEDEDIISEGEVRDAVLVTDGDNEIGQMVILSLIIKRSRVKALVKNKRAAVESFGTYVESMAGDATDKKFQKKALRGVRAIICPNEGFLSNVESLKGVQHVILLSQLSAYEGSSGIQAVMNSNSKKMAAQDEAVITNAGIPYTIIRTGSLTNTPGGKLGFSFKEVFCTEDPWISKITLCLLYVGSRKLLLCVNCTPLPFYYITTTKNYLLVFYNCNFIFFKFITNIIE
nr:PREDICTED: uncharacterized protein LOC108206200 isoform X2 [Daucus carota subsp. sativus]